MLVVACIGREHAQLTRLTEPDRVGEELAMGREHLLCEREALFIRSSSSSCACCEAVARHDAIAKVWRWPRRSWWMRQAR